MVEVIYFHALLFIYSVCSRGRVRRSRTVVWWLPCRNGNFSTCGGAISGKLGRWGAWESRLCPQNNQQCVDRCKYRTPDKEFNEYSNEASGFGLRLSGSAQAISNWKIGNRHLGAGPSPSNPPGLQAHLPRRIARPAALVNSSITRTLRPKSRGPKPKAEAQRPKARLSLCGMTGAPSSRNWVPETITLLAGFEALLDFIIVPHGLAYLQRLLSRHVGTALLRLGHEGKVLTCQPRHGQNRHLRVLVRSPTQCERG